eukprot:Hpha_TRINITY_DN16129_c1_g3::TRINITY_DN16129_c1_g3_i1::g.8366::m.8366/K05643/ABCA3; ATP-binding cassette, subfamily A (ABC1), member 3
MADVQSPRLAPREGGPSKLPGFWSNLGTILHKNWLLKRKMCGKCPFVSFGVLLEVLLPTIIFIGLIPVWKVVDTDDKPDQEFMALVDFQGHFNGDGSWSMPCPVENISNWTVNGGGLIRAALAQGLPLSQCASIAASPKCRRFGTNDPELAAFPECLENCTSGAVPCQTDDACIGNLCLRLGWLSDDNPDVAGQGLYAMCLPFTLYPFVFNKGDFKDATYNGQPCGYEAARVKVPDFDTLSIVRKFAYAHMGDGEAGFFFGDELQSGYEFGIVAPEDTAGNSIVQGFREFMTNGTRTSSIGGTYTFGRAPIPDPNWNEEDAIYYATHSGSQRVFAIISITEQTDDTISYDIRMNRTAVPLTTKINKVFVSKGLGEDFPLYVRGGFLSLQMYLNEYLTETSDDAFPELTPMPLKSYTENPFLALVGGFLAFFMAVILIYPVSQLISAMVREKEQRMREVMLVMGLSPTAFRLSWFLTSALQMFVSCLLGCFVLKVSYVSKVDFLLLLVLFVLYFWSVAALAILIASFFSKAQLASVAGPVIFFGTVIIGQSVPEDAASGLRNFVSIFSTYPFTQAMTLVSQYESAELGAQWGDLGKDDPYTLGTAMGWLIFDLIAYLVLAWYVDNVLPGEWGTSNSCCFCFFPSYWCPKDVETRVDNQRLSRRTGTRGRSRHATNEYIEEIPPEMMARRKVAIMDLRKEFKQEDGSIMTAVSDVNLDMFEGQIQVLLGHNGAGKTTTINMITGMMGIDSGDANIYGHSVKTQLPIVRADVGLCPQHNVLWDTLSCAEHLRFFAKLRGVPSDELESRVDAVLEEVELSDKKNVSSAALSGGMKRKLSVAITLIGDCRFCIFDEPTAGMDVQARRAIWDLLKRSKEGRTVLLTTHFMDEADLLGDSIAIMHKGMLPYWGSSLFLKNRLGVGYSLRLDYAGDDEGRRQVKSFVEEKIGEEVSVSSSSGRELCFRLPLTATSKFGSLFRALEGDDASKLHVEDYGVGVTTLEEVFLRIAQDDIEEEASDDDSVGPSPAASATASPTASGSPEKEGLLDEHRISVKAARGWEVEATDLLTDAALYSSQWNGLIRKRINNYKRDKKLLCCQLLLPVILITLACAIDQIPTADPPSLSLVNYDDDDPVLFPIAPAGASLFDLFPGLPDFQKLDNNAANASALNAYLLDTFDNHGDDDRYQAFFQNTAGQSVMFHNTSNRHATAISLNTLATANLRRSKPGAQIIGNNFPLPLSDFRKKVLQGVQTVSKTSLIYAPFTFVPSVFAGLIVLERVRKAKLVQLVSGVKLTAYWASNYVFDLVLYCITIVLGIIILAMFNRTEYTSVSEGHLPATVLLLLFYGFAAIGVSYWASFFFQSHTTAQNIILIGNFLPAVVLLTVTTILQLIDSTRSVGEALLYVFRLFPAFVVGEGLQALALRELYATLGFGNTGPFAVCNGYGCNGVGLGLIYLALETPIIFFTIFAMEKPEVLYWLGLKKQSEKGLVDDHGADVRSMVNVEDSDVAKERAEVEGGQRDGDLVTVKRLFHQYPSRGGAASKLAVKGLSFGVHGQEIFGFLGTNGAGKTTTISVMAGEFVSTSGSVTIAGHDIVTDTQAARQQIGYCPQFDALLDLMTPRETIQLYCALRGVPHSERTRVTDALVKDMGLRAHQNKKCKSLSGGNKRKTSICIALVGGPAVVLLDEPTAGMDPSARRTLWESLKKVGQGRCVVLTTHHLEEVEALAQRVGIMVSGQMECLGSLQRLKDKFGKGYQFEVKLHDPGAVENMKDFVSREFRGKAELTEEAGLRLTFQLPKDEHPLSEIFDLIEQNRKCLKIVDYAVQQTSLEQVFMAICRRHLENEDLQHAGAATAEVVPVADMALTGTDAQPRPRQFTGAD